MVRVVIPNCLYSKNDDMNEKEKRDKKIYGKNKKLFNKKKSGGKVHIGKEWNSDDESSTDDEGLPPSTSLSSLSIHVLWTRSAKIR